MGKVTFALKCDKHGQEHSDRAKFGKGYIKELFGTAPKGKKKSGCPICRKEYIKRHNIKDASGIDWRYVELNEEV